MTLQNLMCAVGWHNWPRWRKLKRQELLHVDGEPLEHYKIVGTHVRRCRNCGKRETQ